MIYFSVYSKSRSNTHKTFFWWFVKKKGAFWHSTKWSTKRLFLLYYKYKTTTKNTVVSAVFELVLFSTATTIDSSSSSSIKRLWCAGGHRSSLRFACTVKIFQSSQPNDCVDAWAWWLHREANKPDKTHPAWSLARPTHMNDDELRC